MARRRRARDIIGRFSVVCERTLHLHRQHRRAIEPFLAGSHSPGAKACHGRPSTVSPLYWWGRRSPPELCGGPIAFESLRDLFTPTYVGWRTEEMRVEGWTAEHDGELRHLQL